MTSDHVCPCNLIAYALTVWIPSHPDDVSQQVIGAKCQQTKSVRGLPKSRLPSLQVNQTNPCHHVAHGAQMSGGKHGKIEEGYAL